MMKVTSGWSCSAEAETAEVIGPSMDFATAAALAAPEASRRILRASKIVRMPMVIAQRGLSSPRAQNFALSVNVSLLDTFLLLLRALASVGPLDATLPS